MGAEAVKKLLEDIDCEKLSEELKKDLETAQGQKRVHILKRLEVVESFRISGNRRGVDDSRCRAGYPAG